MAIRIAPRAADLAGDLAGRFVVLLRGAPDAERAMAALHRGRQALLDLAAEHGARPLVSGVVLSPDGPLFRVSGLDLGDEELHAVPGVVADALAEAGLDDGTVDVIEPVGPLDALDDTPNAAILRVFPTPAGAAGILPPRWLDVAAEWTLGDATANEPVAVRLLGAPFSISTSDAPAILHAANGSRTWCDLVYGDLRGRLRSASLTFGFAPHLALAAGGPGCDIPALLARFELLCELARDLREGVAYACVDLEGTFAQIGVGLSATGWRAHGGASPNAVVGQVGDVAVPDAYPYQVLGPGHRARRQQHGPEPLDTGALGQPLEGGRSEVALGDPADWLPRYETREEAREQGWTELSGLLLTDPELAELVARRLDDARSEGGAAPDAPAAPDGGLRSGPDLDDIVLDALPHPRRGLHVTLLELASWLGHEPHSDAPGTVSPVLAAYGRWLSSGMDNTRRQALKPYAARLVGTRGPGLSSSSDWRPLAGSDDARAWMAADALARRHAPAWLRAAGLGPLADRVAKVRPRRDHQHVERLARLLGTAIDVLGVDDGDDRVLGALGAGVGGLRVGRGLRGRVDRRARRPRVGHRAPHHRAGARSPRASRTEGRRPHHRGGRPGQRARRRRQRRLARGRAERGAGRRRGDARRGQRHLPVGGGRAGGPGRRLTAPPRSRCARSGPGHGRRCGRGRARASHRGWPGSSPPLGIATGCRPTRPPTAMGARVERGPGAHPRGHRRGGLVHGDGRRPGHRRPGPPDGDRGRGPGGARGDGGEASGLAARAVASGTQRADAPDERGVPTMAEVVDELQAGALELFDALLAVRDPGTRGSRTRHHGPRPATSVA